MYTIIQNILLPGEWFPKLIMLLSIKYLTFDITFGSTYYNKSFHWKDEKGDTEEEQKSRSETSQHAKKLLPVLCLAFVWQICSPRNWNVHVRCPNVFVTVHLPLDNMSKNFEREVVMVVILVDGFASLRDIHFTMRSRSNNARNSHNLSKYVSCLGFHQDVKICSIFQKR